MPQSLIPFISIALGILFPCLALLISPEYRQAFFESPQSIVSPRVFARVLGTGLRGYLAILAVVSGGLLVVAGIAVLILMASAPVLP